MALAPVVGLDGHSPFMDNEARWTMWSLAEIYQGTVGEKKYVPKVKDYVIDPDEGTTYIVTAVNPVTLVATLKETVFKTSTGLLTEEEILLGVNSDNPATYRVYIDKTVTPYALAVDARFKIGGTMAKKAKLFRGSDLSGAGETISKLYDSGMNFVSDIIPLELIAIDSHVNHAIKAIPPCRCTHDLQDGELVTAVIYDDRGHVVSKRQFLVENTGFIRHTDYAKKHITHISLESIFNSETQVDTLEYPLNLPLNSLNLLGVVHYSDGTVAKLPVDGTKFQIFGLDQYVSTILGQSIDLVLAYNLSLDEVSYSPNQTYNRVITKDYKLITVNPNNSYTVKLYVYPVWVPSISEYQLRFYILNLSKNLFQDVTPLVYFNAPTAFNGKLYGIVQQLSVSINLSQVSSTFRDFIHTQNCDVVLYGKPDAGLNTTWEVSHERIADRPFYGTLLKARRIGTSSLNVAGEITVQNEWISRVYSRTYPLYNPVTETAAMLPSHFRIKYKTVTVDYPISQWDQNLDLGIPVSLSENVTIVFLNKDLGDDKILSVSEMIIRDI